MKTFFFFWPLTPTLRAKLLCGFPKMVFVPNVRNTGTGPSTGAMLTKPTKSTQPKKLPVPIMPSLLSLHVMPLDLACYA